MPSLPDAITALLPPLAVGFDPRTWRKVQALRIDAVLAPRKRIVSSALHVLGLHERADFVRYPQVRNRAVGSSLAVSRIRLHLRLPHRVADPGRVWRDMDETVERRGGPRIAAQGVYRDGVRGPFVKAMGLRWISLMLWVSPLPWTRRVWALPFLTVRAPSVRYHEARGSRHKTLTTWARQMRHVVRRWLPARERVVVGDRRYAALYAPAPLPTPGLRGRPRLKGHRLPSLRTILTDPATRGTPLTLTWPDGTVRTRVYASGTAVGYHPGHPPVPLRWAAARSDGPPGALSSQLGQMSRRMLEPEATSVHVFAAIFSLIRGPLNRFCDGSGPLFHLNIHLLWLLSTWKYLGWRVILEALVSLRTPRPRPCPPNAIS